jgi:glycosyltransferase involved in cell wall biosynthesis
MASRRILIIGNYLADNQQSMFRFAHLLVSFYQPFAETALISPPVIIGSLGFAPPGVRKYLAYVDKLLIFPIWLCLIARRYDLVHIADHGNAYYSFCCPSSQSLITCHDLLAVRTVLGDVSTACTASPIGFLLQRLILAGLRRAGSLVFVSQATFRDFQRIIKCSPSRRYTVIHNSFNASFTSDISCLELAVDEKSSIPPSPFLLMVGSSHPRKNRRMALLLLLELGPQSPYRIVFAGAPCSPDDLLFIAHHDLSNKVTVIHQPSHSLLNALYCLSHALLFPSYAEGFGWPLIEAQSSGCPVIASTTTSIPEVAGDAALYADPDDISAFAHHVRSLEDQVVRQSFIDKGFLNITKYDPGLIAQAYARFAFGSTSH